MQILISCLIGGASSRLRAQTTALEPPPPREGTPEKQNLSRSKGSVYSMTEFGNIVDGLPCSSRWGKAQAKPSV